MPKQVKTCNYCGQTGLEWTRTDAGWRLKDPATGLLHTHSRSATPITHGVMDAATASQPASSLADLLDELDTEDAVNNFNARTDDIGV